MLCKAFWITSKDIEDYDMNNWVSTESSFQVFGLAKFKKVWAGCVENACNSSL